MPAVPTAWRRCPPPCEAIRPLRPWLAGKLAWMGGMLRWVNRRRPAGGRLAGLLVVWLVASAWATPAWADTALIPRAYICAGEPLSALLVKGPMDEPAIPDPSTAPVPIGGSVVLSWRGLSLQLPRTNNAGPASFSDGKWWWSLEDPAHPRFRLRRPLGDIQDFVCEALEA